MKNKYNLYRLKKAIGCSTITSLQLICEQTGIDKRILLLALDGKTMLNINEYKELSKVLEVPFEWVVGISDDIEQEEI